MITSKLTGKGRTTIPLLVRNALGLSADDELVYTIKDGRVVLGKAGRELTENPFATFSEWSSEADCIGYADL